MRRIKTNSLGARVLSGFLSLLMVVSACPVTAFADDDVDNTPVESTTIVVDENGVHVDGEDDGYTIIVDEESDDENVDSIPGDEDAQDQNNPDVDTPPNIDNGSDDDGTNPDIVISVDDEDEDNTDEDAEPTEEDEIVDENPIDEEEVEETAEPEYEYSVTLPDNTTVSEGDTLEIEAEVVAKVTIDEETKDVDYTFEFSGEGVNIETKTATGAAITFDKAGEYTIVGKLIVEDEEVASDEMTVKVNPIVVFDHYFTEIDESLVETSDLLVKTSDSSVFTKNTNVVSNFDDVYIIECSSVEEARYVYSYYVDKVDSISDLSKVISIATDENDEDVADLEDLNDGNDALAQLNEEVENTEDTDYSDYIALIDTGADDADVKFSVVGDDVNDSNGHGSRMLELIKNENPNAKVMSIRVFDGSTTDAASVYAGIKLAIENDVKIINLSLVGSDVEKNAIVKDVIQEAIDKGIVVIGAAGNYNISATKFIPGCIEDVITVGAANSNGTKKSNSNYDVDYYVVADSTSEATAIFTGLYSNGINEDSRLYGSDLNPTRIITPITDLPEGYEWLNGIPWEFTIHDDGSVGFKIPIDEYMIFDDDFTTAVDGNIAHKTTDAPIAQIAELAGSSNNQTTYSHGSASFASNAPTSADGYASNFSKADGDGIFEKAWEKVGSPSIYASCDRYWNDDTKSAGANMLNVTTVYYKATGKITHSTDGSQAFLNVDLLLSAVDNDWEVNWTETSNSTSYYISITEHVTGQQAAGSFTGSVYCHWEIYGPSGSIKNGNTSTTNMTNVSLVDYGKYLAQARDGALRDATSQSSAAATAIIGGAFSGHKATVTHASEPVVVGSLTDQGGGNHKASITVYYQTTSEKQKYKGIFDARAYRRVYVNMTKTRTAPSRNGSYYLNEDTFLKLYDSDGNAVVDVNGNAVEWHPGSDIAAQTHNAAWALDYGTYYGKTLTLKEITTGFGYRWGQSSTNYSMKTDSRAATSMDMNNPTMYTINNIPMQDPLAIQIRKVSNNGGTNLSGDINVNGAQYTLTGFNVTTNCEKSSSNGFSNVYTTSTVAGVPGIILLNSVGNLPVGYYELKETKAPAGMKINNTTYSFYILPNGCTPGNNNSSAYLTANDLSIFMYEGVGHSGTLIYSSIGNNNNNANPTIYINPNYRSTVGNGVALPLTEGDNTARNVDEEVWYPMGLLKADFDMNDYSGLHGDGILGTAEGNGKYEGAVYQLYLTTNSSSYFQTTYNNPNGAGNNFTFGTGATYRDGEDGFGQTVRVTFSDTAEGTLYPVLYNGTPVTITTNQYGYAATSMKFPYGDDYRWVEIKAPTGYKLSTRVYKVSTSDWYVSGNNHDTPQTWSTYTGSTTVVRPTEVNGLTSVAHRDGTVDDAIYRYGFAMWKKDLTNSDDRLDNTQGDSTLNGIRFAVINTSDHHVVMRNTYNTIDGGYVDIVDGKEIGTNRICAIITTHTHNGLEGYLTMYGLPYGTYDIAELRYDAPSGTSLIGQAYNNGNGSSIYANPCYLWDGSNYFSVDYTVEAGNELYYGEDGIDYFTWDYTAQDPDHIAMNKVIVSGFQGYKLDTEYLAITEGDSSANGIRFAVVNRSTDPVEILQSDIDKLSQVDPNWNAVNPVTGELNVQFIAGGTTRNGVGGTGNSAARIAPGSVVAILTTHDKAATRADGQSVIDGYFAIYGLPYGSYEVIELRRDAVVSVGQAWNTVNTGSDPLANDSFFWRDTHVNYTLHDTGYNTAESALTKNTAAYNSSSNPYQDYVLRYGFALWKKDLTNSNDVLGNIQGDDSLNGIRYAVINKSKDPVRMFNTYNTIDGEFVTINDGQIVQPNQICAVITTHTHDSKEGYLTMYGLPFGRYDIVELKYDAAASTSLIGQVYDNNGMGNSTYANDKGIMWDGSRYFSFDYTTDANKPYYGPSAISHFTWTYDAPTSDPDHIFENKAFVDGFQGYKLDEDYLEVTEGDSNANGIRFAIINRSAREVEILQSDIDKLATVDPAWNAMNPVLENTPNVQFIPGGTTIDNIGTGDASARIAPGHVVAILTTHDGPITTATAGTHTGEKVDGYFAIYGLPYGTYEVVELRRDAEISVGQDWNAVDKGTSIYANDSFYWNNISIMYALTDLNHQDPHNTAASALAIHNDPYNPDNARYTDDVYRDGFSFWKRDKVYNWVEDHPQGDSTWNDIRYVVINKSDDQVKMFDKYTALMPTSDQPYVEIKDGVAIDPGCVVAILTSHQKSNVAADELTKGYEQGYVALFGLPYGQYEIHELRADATIEVGDNYANSNKLGSSCFANYRVNSQLIGVRTDIANNPSMLFNDDTYFYYTLHDTGEGSDDHNGGNVSDGSDGNSTAGELILMGDLQTEDDNNKATYLDDVVYGNLKIKKIDDETKIDAFNQGANRLDHVQFAVVNRSYWSVCYPYTETSADNPDRYFEPDEVIAILETDENGECNIDHLPYGTYEVYELRINQSYNTDVRTINLPNNNGDLVEVTCYGNTIQPHFVWNDAAMEAYKDWQKDYAAHEAGTAVNGVAGQEGQYFGTDDRANEWYTWNEYISNYFVVQPEHLHEIGSNYSTHTEDDRTIRGYVGTTGQRQTSSEYEPQVFEFTWSDLPVRADFKMQKANIDGDYMAYVPWLVSLVETDENGQPLMNDDGSYKVVIGDNGLPQEHVIVLDFDAMFDSRNWDARPKTADNLNKWDSYVSFDDELGKLVWTGTKEDLKAAATGNIWFGDIELELPNDKYIIKQRGSLLAGTYVIQEIPRVEKYGFPKTGEGSRERVNLGNGKYREIVWNTEDYDMISSTLKVVHDNPNPVLLLDDFDIGVDVPLTIQSEAIDAITETNSTVPDADSLLRDTVTFGGLNTSQRYGYRTYIWRCAEDGTPIEQIYESDMCTLDFTGDKWTNPDTNREYNTLRNADPAFTSVVPDTTHVTDNGSFTIVDNGYTVFRDADGNFTVESRPDNDPTNDRFNVLYDLSIIQDFNLDTTMMQEGEKICFAVNLYKSMGANGWSLVKEHNPELNEKSQIVGIIKFVTESTDKTTRTRVAGLGGYAYGLDENGNYNGMPLVDNAAATGNLVYNADGEIVGYTLIDDKIVYSNLGDKHNYRFQAKLTYVGEDGLDHVVRDIYGNECSTDLVAIFIDKDLDHVMYGTDIVYEDGDHQVVLQHSLEGPCDGEITFSDLGMMDWIIPNMPNDAKTVYIKTYLYDARGPVITCHNFDLDKEDENIRWLQIETTAMSEVGDQGVLPNGRSWDLDGQLIKGDAILRDNIHYSNLAEPITARVEGYVYLVGYDENGKRFIDTDNGLDTPYVAYETKNFELTGTEGDVEMQYTIVDSGQYAKRELVVCERVYMDLPGHAGVHADGKYVPGPGPAIDARHTVYVCANCGDTFTSYDESKYHERQNHHHCQKQIVYDTIVNDNYYLNDDGDTEVLIALHEDINDEMQTVSIPEIETHLVNRHEGTDYKVVSREYADVTVYDTVTFKNLKVGEPWVFTAELMDQETKLPVLDAEGNPVVATGTITPDATNSTIDPVTGRAYGTIEIPITFKQVLTALDWESDPSWVCFESMTKGDNGHAEFKYAVHNNIYDERQTVHLPTFRTTVVSTVADPAAEAAVNAKDRQIQAAPNQTITDTVEIKNVGLDTVIKSNLKDTDNTITDIIPSTFTLRIAAVDGETGEPIVDAEGKQFTATKKVVVDVKRDADGKVITPYVTTINGVENSGEAFFKQYPDGNGTDFTQLLLGTDDKPILVDIDLTIDATKYKGKTIMFEERLYFGEFDTEGHEVLIEDDFTNVEQQVTVPDLHTTAVDAETGEHTITISGNNATGDDWYLHAEDPSTYDWKIKDTVSMNKITPNTDYTLVTIVINKDTGKPVVNLADGSKFIQYTPYKSPASVATGAAVEYKCECGKDGCVGIIAVDDEFDIELNLNKTDARNGGTFVVYEYMLLGTNNTYVPGETVAVPNDCYAYHNDINDTEQTIVIPEIHTEFLESHTEIHVVPLEEDATVTDYVHYKGLVPGKHYIMQCVLMNKSTGEPYYLTNESGNTLELITQDVPFTASETGEGDVEVSFTIPADQLHDFDYELDKDHLDIDRTVTDVGTPIYMDEDGTVHEPDVSGNTAVIDNKYEGTEARTERGISDEEKINVTKSTQIVAFERCISDEEPSHVYAIHADIEDEKQTILVPRIFTHLTDTVIGDHVSRWNTTETITDTVTFVSLQADKEYTIEGYLVNVDTEEPILDKDGNRITATKTFIPKDLPDTQVTISDGKLIASGNVDLVFTFDSTALKGTHVVAFEDCYYKEIKVATHSDINDQWQWTFVPEIGTTADGYVKAADNNGVEYREKVVPYGEKVQIVDVVEYNKLLPGVWYEMSGTVMDKATGKALTIDGKTVTATTRFLPAESEGKVEVVFTLDTTNLEGKTLVVFEECLYVGAKKDGTPNKEAVAKHEDISDEDQTVYIPKIRTTVKDKDGNTQVYLDGTQTQTIIDTVTYENLVPGKEYTVTGKLVFKKDYGDSKDYEYVKDANGNIITASTTFTPTVENSKIGADGLASGTVDVKFEFNAGLTAGRKVVVFEDMYLEKVRVATHSDINDENQTFDTSMRLHVKLVKSDFDNHEYVLKNAEITIFTDEKCTQIAKDINGNDCVGKTNEKGEVEFIIVTYDENQIFYAKETKAPFGYKICDTVIPIKGTPYYNGTTDNKTDYTEESSLKESDGVCAINLKMFDKIIIIPPKTGDNLPILPIMIISLLGLLCVGAFFATKRKKVVAEVDSADNAEEMDEEEVMDAVTGMMTEEIDGDGHNDSGF